MSFSWLADAWNWLKMAFRKLSLGRFTPTPAGKIDIRYEDGIEPSAPPDIQINTIPTQTTVAGVSYSQDFASYVTGADKGSGSYSITAVTGTLTALGLSFTTSTLSGATPVQGTFTGRLVVTASGYTFTSDPFIVNVIQAVTTDTQSPVSPLAPGVSIADTVATISGEWPADVRTATIPPTDPVRVIIERSVNGGSYSTLTTLTADQAQPSPPRVSATIGTLTSPSSSHNGKDLSVTVQDGTYSDSAENAQFEGWQVSGSFDLIVTIPVFTSGSEWASFGPVFRETLTSRARSVMIARRADSYARGTPMQYRSEPNGPIGWTPDANLSGSVTLKLSRVYPSNVFTASFWDEANSAWVVYGTQTVDAAATGYAGVQGYRVTVGSAVTMSATNVWLNALGRYSYADTVANGNTYAYRVKARDSASTPNDSAYSAVTSRIVGSTTPAIKFNPGHYVVLDGKIRGATRAAQMATHQPQIAELANEPTVRGVKVFAQWSALEGAQGDYSAGISMVRQYLTWCRAVGKQFVLAFEDRQFGGYGSDYTLFFPSYIVNGAAYGTTVMTNGLTSRVWQANTMDRVIALLQAYGAEFDSDPNFERMEAAETAVAVTGGADGFSNAALTAQLQRLCPAFEAAWPTTGRRISANYLVPDSLAISLFATMRTNRIMGLGPDIIPSESIQCNQIFKGLRRAQTSPLGSWGSATSGTDYRGVMPIVVEVQSPSLGGHEGTWTAQELDVFARVTEAMYPQYYDWYRNTWSGGTAQRWSTGILPYIRSINGYVASGSSSTLIAPSAVPKPSGYP